MLWPTEQLLKQCTDRRALACECALECPLSVCSTLAQLRTEAQLCSGARAFTRVKVSLLAQGNGPNSKRAPGLQTGAIETTVCTVACDLIVWGRGRIQGGRNHAPGN